MAYNLFIILSLIVGSWNIKAQTSGDKDECNWSNRYSYVARTITDNNFDILGVQELKAGTTMYSDLIQSLPDYDIYYWCVGSAKVRSGLGNGIIYKRDRFEVLDQGFFFLGTDINKPLFCWDADQQRITVWMHLLDKQSNQDFFYFSTHLDVTSSEARKEEAKVNITQMRRIAGFKPAFMVGDFNTGYTDKIVHGYMRSQYADAHPGAYDNNRDNTRPPKWNGTNKMASVMDYVYTNGKVDSFAVIHEFYGREYAPSDHLAVWAQVNLVDASKQQHTWSVSDPNQLQSVIDNSHAGDTILLLKDVVFGPIKIPHSLVVIGGYNSTFTEVESQTAFTSSEQGPIILATNFDSEVTLYNLEIYNGHCTTDQLCYGSAVFASTVGLELYHCHIHDCQMLKGGAVFSSGRLVIDSCSFTNNSTSEKGGAVYGEGNGWYTRIANSTFDGNSAYEGAAAYIVGPVEYWPVGQGRIILINNVFTNNINAIAAHAATVYLGGTVTSKQVTLTGNYFDLNEGEGVYVLSKANSAIKLIQNTFTRHTAPAVDIVTGSVFLSGNIIASNSDTSDVVFGTGTTLERSQFNVYTSEGKTPFALSENDTLSADWETDREKGLFNNVPERALCERLLKRDIDGNEQTIDSLTTDRLGTMRPLDGTATRGAYQLISELSDLPTIVPANEEIIGIRYYDLLGHLLGDQLRNSTNQIVIQMIETNHHCYSKKIIY